MGDTESLRIAIANGEIHVEATGKGPDLILAAGLGGRGQFWAKQIAAFSQYFRVTTFDHRSCGKSEGGTPISSVADLASDVIAIMNALGIKRTHFIGHSTGGAIGQHIAVDYGDRISALVLSCTWPGTDAYLGQLFAARRKILVESGAENYFSFGAFLSMPSSDLQELLQRDPEYVLKLVANYSGLGTELSRIDAILAHDLRDRLHNVASPSLCIGAQDDQITPASLTTQLGSLIGHAETHILPRGGHFCPIVETETYNARVLQFLLKHR